MGMRRSRNWYSHLTYITTIDGEKTVVESNIAPISDVMLKIDSSFYEYAGGRQLVLCEDIINHGVNDKQCSDGQINPPIVAKNSSISLYDCDMSYVSSIRYHDNTSTVLIAQECEINIHNCQIGTMLVRDTTCRVYNEDTEIQTLMLCGNDNRDIPSIEQANIFRYAVAPTSQGEQKTVAPTSQGEEKTVDPTSQGEVLDVPQYTLTIIKRNVRYPLDE